VEFGSIQIESGCGGRILQNGGLSTRMGEMEDESGFNGGGDSGRNMTEIPQDGVFFGGIPQDGSILISKSMSENGGCFSVLLPERKQVMRFDEERDEREGERGGESQREGMRECGRKGGRER